MLIGLMCLLTLAWWSQPRAPALAAVTGLGAHGIAYAPALGGPDGVDPATIADDLGLLARHAGAIRTYSVSGALSEVPALAARHDLSVALGGWLTGRDAATDQAELDRLLAVAAASPNVDRLIVGNETLLHGRLPADALIRYLRQVRAATDIPVTTAEPWHVWLDNPRLAASVDLITVHLLPYWEGVRDADAVDYLLGRLRELQQAFPDKPLVIGEVGWPTRGAAVGTATPAEAAQAAFVRRFVSAANAQGLEYFLLEAFDQPWKRPIEGEVGAYWGLFDNAREPRMVVAGSEPARSKAVALGVVASLASVTLFLLLVCDAGRLARAGRALFAATAVVLAGGVVQGLDWLAARYWAPAELAVGLLMGVVGALALAVLLVEIHEWVEVRWAARTRLRRADAAPWPRTGRDRPLVSIHVPVHDEPPALVTATLDALAALDYPRFEVLVIDNNTADDRRWRPLEAHCAALGPRFRFHHVENLAGYKAGALNLALRLTDPEASLVAVVDSDYQVDPAWLRVAVPCFDDTGVALVQAPQDYRDGSASPFKSACVAEYATFFRAGMVTRNERNAIIQHGTMTMVRRDVLDHLDGWAEWCITEDAELGLRILAAGYRSVYVGDSLGAGVSPDSFAAYRAQRYRWAFGAVQILRRHARLLWRPGPHALSAAQRFHFVGGWLPWLADGLGLLMLAVAVPWSLLMIAAPASFSAPPAVFMLPPLLLFSVRLLKSLHLQRDRQRDGVVEGVLGVLAGLALSFTVGRAVLAACRRRGMPFLRTPKLAGASGLAGALRSVRVEATLGLLIGLCVAGVSWRVPAPGPDTTAWIALLLAAALPQLAAVVMALLAARPFSNRRPIGEDVDFAAGLLPGVEIAEAVEQRRVGSP
jgi:exo-beta-1,3-glucanase (GH17 family)/cellulose synthase/poly-beta-1,6-N-acetylglucosamine synthase-like glycosyltransferase